MTEALPPRADRRTLLAIALLSASLLAFQVLLTRVCALRLHFHFGFLIISNSLLGIGASGSLLALVEAKWRRDPAAWIWGFAAAFVLSLVLSWCYLLTAQIPETLSFLSWRETGRFALFNLACAVPFFFGGTAVGLILANNARNIGTVYAADLIGAGLGCLLCPLLLWPVGAGGCFAVAVILGVFGALAAAPPSLGMAGRCTLFVVAVFAAMWAPRLDGDFPVPGKRWLDLTIDYTLTAYGKPVYSQWSANSRIDVLPLPAGQHFLQARGSKAMNMPLPRQWWIGQDGDAGTMLSDFGSEPDKLPLLEHTMYSAAFALKQGTKPNVCIIGVGGASDLWAAKLHDCSKIRGIELNRAIAEVHGGVAAAFSKPLLDDPRVRIDVDEGRSALMRTDEHYDVIQLTGIDTWTALNSGAYVLAENYLYTVQACRAMYDRLADGGILQITRMAAGMETIRLMHNMYASLPPDAQAAFPESVAALKTDNDYLITVMLKKGAFTADERTRLDAFTADAGIRYVAPPGRDRLRQDLEALTRSRAADEKAGGPVLDFASTRADVIRFLSADDKARFVDDYPYDISPTTDDRPYFFSFLRWTRPELARSNLNTPTSRVQGNPLFLWQQLLWSSVAAALFIVLPLLFRRRTTDRSRAGALPMLVYFAGLGFGFIAIEVALIQKFTLLLGQPLYSIVVTLFSILVFTGVGSLLSTRALRSGRTAFVPIGACVLLLAIAFGSESLVQAAIGWPLFARALLVAAVIAPLAILLGMPFAHGIAIVQRQNPSLVPWAWAVNGSTTVIGSIATVILSMNFGFAAVLLIAGAVYLVAFAALRLLRPAV